MDIIKEKGFTTFNKLKDATVKQIDIAIQPVVDWTKANTDAPSVAVKGVVDRFKASLASQKTKMKKRDDLIEEINLHNDYVRKGLLDDKVQLKNVPAGIKYNPVHRKPHGDKETILLDSRTITLRKLGN